MSTEQPTESRADRAPRPSRPVLRALRRRGPLLLVSVVIATTAGVVLAQVLQPQDAPAAPAAAISKVIAAVPVVPAAAPAPRFELVTVERGELQASVEAAGKLQLYKYVDVNAQIGGEVRQVLVAVGDSVKAGALMLEITPTVQPTKVESQRAQMARLQAELADQAAQLDYAQLQYKRQSQLKAQNATREDAYESSRMGVSSASARVDSINAQIRQLEANLKIDEDRAQHAQVVAPVGGTVVALTAHVGQSVAPGQGQPALLRIADLSKMTVQARVAEADVTRLRKGMPAQFTTPGYPGQHWTGKLRQVMPIPAEGTGEQGKETFYNVLFDVANPDQQLMSGMSTQVRFMVARVKDALLLPARALGAADADGVYRVAVLDGERQRSERKVKVGLRNGEQVQVLAGLAAGDQVIVGMLPAPANAVNAVTATTATTAAAAAQPRAAAKPAPQPLPAAGAAAPQSTTPASASTRATTP